MSKANLPIEGDDAGNLIKAGYAASELALAKKQYENLAKGAVESDISFSEYLFQAATMNYLVNTVISKQVAKEVAKAG